MYYNFLNNNLIIKSNKTHIMYIYFKETIKINGNYKTPTHETLTILNIF